MSLPLAQADEDEEAREFVEWGNGLARRFYEEMGCVVPEGYRFDKARHPQERMCWRLAVVALEEVDGTDLQEMVDELEG
jgi:hypothetical protein